MARYKVLLDPSEFLLPEALVPGDSASRRPIEEGSYRVRGSGPPLGENALGELLDRLVGEWNDEREKSDGQFALAVRESLPLSRRNASDRDLWVTLNLTVGWSYVVWRWSGRNGVGIGRVTGHLDRSALARLWWMAELSGGSTRADRESRLMTLLRYQDRAVQIYERPRLFRRSWLVPELLRVSGDRSSDWAEAGYRAFASSTRAAFGVRMPAEMSEESIGRLLASRAESTVRTEER